jgi:hypothetical protein
MELYITGPLLDAQVPDVVLSAQASGGVEPLVALVVIPLGAAVIGAVIGSGLTLVGHRRDRDHRERMAGRAVLVELMGNLRHSQSLFQPERPTRASRLRCTSGSFRT